MGSMKMDLYTPSKSFNQIVDHFFHTAFGPSLALYRHVSLCGWRPLGVRLNVGLPHADTIQGLENRTQRFPLAGIEIYETCDAMTIQVALNGVNEESLHLSISGKTVIIRGERIATAQRGSRSRYPLGQHTRFQHLIPLPATVKTGGFRAQLKGDVVQIDFAKRRMG